MLEYVAMDSPRRVEIYLDNAATTPPHQTVVEAVVRALATDYGNPSSLHQKGLAAERIVTAARDTAHQDYQGRFIQCKAESQT